MQILHWDDITGSFLILITDWQSRRDSDSRDFHLGVIVHLVRINHFVVCNDMGPLMCFVWLALSWANSVHGFVLFNRTGQTGSEVQYVDASYWFYQSLLGPTLERLHPNVRIWVKRAVGDELARANGFTQIIGDGNRYRLLRRLIRSRILCLIAILTILKVAAGLFVIVVLPNIYFMSMMMME